MSNLRSSGRGLWTPGHFLLPSCSPQPSHLFGSSMWWGWGAEGEWKDSAEMLSCISDPLTWRALDTCADQVQQMTGPGDQKQGLVHSHPVLGGVGCTKSVFSTCVQDSFSSLIASIVMTDFHRILIIQTGRVESGLFIPLR